MLSVACFRNVRNTSYNIYHCVLSGCRYLRGSLAVCIVLKWQRGFMDCFLVFAASLFFCISIVQIVMTILRRFFRKLWTFEDSTILRHSVYFPILFLALHACKFRSTSSWTKLQKIYERIQLFMIHFIIYTLLLTRCKILTDTIFFKPCSVLNF